MNSRFVLALAVSAGMALLVTGIFYQVALSGPGDPEEIPTDEIVVATVDLEPGAIVSASSLRLESWPKDRIPEGSFTDVNDVVERVPASRILAREPVLDRRLSPAGSGVGLSTKVPEGLRAMSVRVDDVNSVSGFVMADASVDVLLTGTPTQSPESRMTRTILSNVRVVSAGENLEPDADGRPQRVAVVTLLLTPDQAEMITLAADHGRIQLVLRNGGDDSIAETDGVVESELFGGRPAPKRAFVKAPVAPAPPPPAPPKREIEVIRGTERSVATFSPSSGG